MKKAEILQLVQDLPDEIDPEELMYRIYLMRKIQEGEEAIAQGDLLTHEEVVRISDEWLK